MTRYQEQYLARLSGDDRWQVLIHALNHLIETGDVRFRVDDYDEDDCEGEDCEMEECFYWTSCGEDLRKM